MTVLKATNMTEADHNAIERFNLNDIEEHARGLVAKAKAERERMLADAKVLIEKEHAQAKTQGHEAGHKVGFSEGYKAGLEQALAEAQADFANQSSKTIAMMHSVLGQFGQVKQDLLWQAEQGTVALALAIAEKVIKQAGTLNHEVTLENVKVALDLVDQRTNVLVKIHPSHLATLEKLLENSAKVFGDFAAIKVRGCETVAPGGCELITEHGGVDAKLETQIKRIVDEIIMIDADAAHLQEALV